MKSICGYCLFIEVFFLVPWKTIINTVSLVNSLAYLLIYWYVIQRWQYIAEGTYICALQIGFCLCRHCRDLVILHYFYLTNNRNNVSLCAALLVLQYIETTCGGCINMLLAICIVVNVLKRKCVLVFQCMHFLECSLKPAINAVQYINFSFGLSFIQ